ncbi:T-cell surface glycoprotein CD3 gamma chain-like [Brachionichthys hirsutus]|uniref:T-cell surface glycoprotein CD3 gamma chain-like n=1 Tax=Brachionichthys hirsutus TaxID=412623 RepID=UPI0036046F7A
MLTAPGSCSDALTAKRVSDGVDLSCGDKYVLQSSGGDTIAHLQYRDDNTGEYTCVPKAGGGEAGTEAGPKIYVKFRTCENCVQLDVPTITGLIVGNLLTTIVVGVAVYLIASQSGPIASRQKSSDKQLLLVPNAVGGGASTDPYQPLQLKRDTYDFLSNRK